MAVIHWNNVSQMILIILLLIVSPTIEALATIKPNTLSKVQDAIKATRESASNITTAYEACTLWSIISDLPDSVQAMASALHAACLVRVGRDTEAIYAYDTSLALGRFLDEATLQDIQIGRASALQRLMRYAEACQQFLDCHTERAMVGAVTCCLRVRDFNKARDVLHACSLQTEELVAMAVTVEVLMGEPLNATGQAALQAASREFPLYQWLNSVLTSHKATDLASFDVSELAAINQSPFDDPLLIHLDDKVLLHQLLAQQGDATFWPQGFFLPQEKTRFQQSLTRVKTDKEWILKSRSGYGSHGNQILSSQKILALRHLNETLLCQRLVNPSLLLDGFKFTMRVYVIYFSDGAVFLSDQGLCKVASRPFERYADDDCAYMTNSGREDTMVQLDYLELRKRLRNAGCSFEEVWIKIESAVKSTMQIYQTLHNDSNRLPLLGIPKVLGFDFIVTMDGDPMLLEVNRFPGLQPRSKDDEAVKHAVVRQAWLCAALRFVNHEGAEGPQTLCKQLL